MTYQPSQMHIQYNQNQTECLALCEMSNNRLPELCQKIRQFYLFPLDYEIFRTKRLRNDMSFIMHKIIYHILTELRPVFDVAMECHLQSSHQMFPTHIPHNQS